MVMMTRGHSVSVSWSDAHGTVTRAHSYTGGYNTRAVRKWRVSHLSVADKNLVGGSEVTRVR